ncbi:nuclease-related domain-containing protein [Shewanella sairae]|nr:nuclease-related domain-containing protein [Shewanella sairae]
MLTILFTIFIFTTFIILNGRLLKGWYGEFLVRLMLRDLPKNEYTVINNITIQTENGTTQIDHIVASKYGLFVIETKNMKGWIYGTEYQHHWKQKIFRNNYMFQNPLHQNYKHTKTLENVLNLTSNQLKSVVIFVGDSRLMTKHPSHVVDSKSSLLKHIKSFNEVVIERTLLHELVNEIKTKRLKPGWKTNLSHNKHVKELVKQKQSRRNGKGYAE